MPDHIRSIECCYCGASVLVNLREANAKSLKCPECSAGMSVGRMNHVAARPDAAVQNDEAARQLAPRWEKRRDRDDDDDDDDRYERSRPRKKKGFFDRLEDLWDDVEDIFD